MSVREFQLSEIKRLFLITLIFVLVFSVSPFRADSAEIPDYRAAIAEYYMGNYQQASEMLAGYGENDIKEHQDFLAVQYLIKAEIKLYNVRRSRELIDFLQEEGYTVGELYWKLGTLYLNKDGHFAMAMYKEARDMFEKARDQGFYGLPQKRDLSRAYMGINDYTRAVEIREEVITADPRAEDYAFLGRGYKQLAELDKAVQFYEELIELDPDRDGVYLDLGDIYRSQNRLERAVETYQRGLDKNPEQIGLRKALAETRFEREEYKDAEFLFSKIAESHPHLYEVHHYLGRIYEKQENWNLAFSSYREAVRYNKEYVTGYISLGSLHFDRGNYEQAADNFQQAIAQNPDHYEGYYHLARAYFALERYESALEEVQKAVSRNTEFEPALELRSMLNELMESETNG